MRTLRTVLAVVASFTASACDPIRAYSPVATNVTDSFEYQATGARAAGATHEYSWMTTGTTATVIENSNITGGKVSILILDATGTQVYLKDLGTNGTFQTSAGTAGTWLIRIVVANLSGSVNIKVQKP